MKATHLTIKKVGESTRTTIVLVGALGVLIGSSATMLISGKFALPSVPARSQLGAVANIQQEESVPTNTVTTTLKAGSPINTSNGTVANREISRVDVTQSKTDITELKLRITDRKIAIDRFNQEIELIKNKSIAVISEFNQNCGSWKDDCAKPYTTKLNEYNSAYNELISKQVPLTRELEHLNTQLAQIAQ